MKSSRCSDGFCGWIVEVHGIGVGFNEIPDDLRHHTRVELGGGGSWCWMS